VAPPTVSPRKEVIDVRINWRKIITIIILILQLIAALIPTLAREARFPTSFTAQEIGQWLVQIYEYWKGVFHGIVETVVRESSP
jgi:hypothetical protein